MKKVIATTKAPAALGPYSQAVLVDNTLYGSGQVGIDPASGQLVDADIEAQTKQVLANISQVLVAADMTFADIVKTTIFLEDVTTFAQVNDLYAAAFADAATLPARSTVEVAKLPAGALIEIEYIASK
ncbi:Rid family detoxifying hydrolase [Loigolactobacillus coryniformis]|jgi:2-iminobutanoate/2-iminopropanoate deaminase|uniref:Endoribonuclease inhibitor of translation n=2 Tax=Loigolactobacillus coryniformis TaxID=1610 RepID=J3JAZ4_9LACO|nr:Rid family detoxifying hydrolase [Loigolactobacillus coryniformis]ATO44857.1 reactive intermediate/imine deaminase [Loigolactobacillus coryniformis subsp. torquens DSM 20004 = KCTC 3535]EJN55282.1 Endoribonuclease inhibitor of translation [Loigolactobacillus coryniformis subsp. coryniformis CECT 5711]KRK82764.1 endoribonuclease L-PSP [Loigolactobacillus coryniformis subsp. torquens DSM 20004 = KCTC 3535]MBW4803534.1 Rid family detoxifying hydrolase [Loigolactobacillus coryniformis subsp. tor